MTGVSLNPSAFSDEGGLLDMTLEEVFRLYHSKNRDTRKEDRDKPILVHCRQVAKGINFTLKLLTSQNGATVSEFALCISFKILAELRAIGVIGAVGKSYSSLLASGVKEALFDELSALTSDYNISRRDGKLQRHFPVYPQVYSALEEVADGCGTSLPKVYQIGLLLALSKSEEAVEGGALHKAVVEIFKPETHDFLRYMAKWRKSLDDGLWW